ncbi:MAG TPA: hypothetical protein VFV88_05250 [Steroidobacteraceae bacterium]|nr:hypothetical protein [Steroidobacteraceae bacterium]
MKRRLAGDIAVRGCVLRKSSVLLGTLAIASALSAAHAWWQLHAERARVASLEQRLEAARTAPPPTPALTDAVVSGQVQQPSTPAIAAPETDAAAAQAARDKELRRQMREAALRERDMMRDPAYRESRQGEWRRRYAQTRADAVRVLGLTPAQADALVDLTIERNIAGMELIGLPGEPMSDETAEVMKRLREQHDARLRDLLGEQKLERWQRFQASTGERSEVGMFRAQLSTTSSPLPEVHADRLADVMYTERQRRDREYEEYATAAGITNRNIVSPQDRQRWIDLEKASNQRIHDSMVGVLDAAQLASLDAMLAGNLAPVEAALRLQLEGRLAKSP